MKKLEERFRVLEVLQACLGVDSLALSLLEKEGIHVARNTLEKYRKQEGIPRRTYGQAVKYILKKNYKACRADPEKLLALVNATLSGGGINLRACIRYMSEAGLKPSAGMVYKSRIEKESPHEQSAQRNCGLMPETCDAIRRYLERHPEYFPDRVS